MRRMLRSAAVPLAVVLTTASPLHAQGWIEIERPPARPAPVQVVRTASTVRVTLDGRIARIEVE